MRRSWIKRGTKGFKKPDRVKGLHLPSGASIGLKRTPLRKTGKSEASLTKQRIQALVRDIVIARDGGCIFRDHRMLGVPGCNGYRKDGELILQADHLITRGNSGTFADTRLIVCVCKGHHGWKSMEGNMRKKEYEIAVKKLISPDRVALWERAEDGQYWKASKVDFRLEEMALEQELRRYQQMKPGLNRTT